MFSVLSFDVFAAKEPCIYGPCTGPDHGSGTAECRQNEWNPRITGVAHRNPEFDSGDEGSHHWGPEADQEKYRQTCPNDLRNHRWRKGCSCEIDDPEANEQEGCQNPLEQKSYTWPAIGKSRKQSLQKSLPAEGRGIATRSKHLKAGGGNPTFGGDSTR